jgi:transposase-like protein
MSENKISQHLKRRFTAEEKRNIYNASAKSELNTTDFCKAYGISKSAFYKWNREFIKENNDLDFSPLSVDKKSSLESEKADGMLQLTVAFTHSTMQIKLEIPEYRLFSFIKEIGDATPIIW